MPDHEVITVSAAPERTATAVQCPVMSLVLEVDGRITVQLHDALNKVLAFATVSPASALCFFAQGQEWCEVALAGQSQQMGHA